MPRMRSDSRTEYIYDFNIYETKEVYTFNSSIISSTLGEKSCSEVIVVSEKFSAWYPCGLWSFLHICTTDGFVAFSAGWYLYKKSKECSNIPTGKVETKRISILGILKRNFGS